MPTFLQMKNTSKYISYTTSAIEIVGLLWRKTGSNIQFTKHLRMYTELWGRLVPVHKLMQNMNNDSMKKIMLWHRHSKAQAQVYAQVPGWLVQQRHKYRQFCTMMFSIHITSEYNNTSYGEIIPTVYDSMNGSNHGYTFGMTFCSQMRLNLPRIVLPTQGICILGHMNIHMIAECNFQH